MVYFHDECVGHFEVRFYCSVRRRPASGPRWTGVACRAHGRAARGRAHGPAKGPVDWSSALEQLTLAEFIASGGYDRHVRAMRLQYRRRRDQLVTALAQRAPDIRVTGMDAGLQVVLELPRGTERSVVQAAARGGLAVSGLADYRYEAAGADRSLPERDALVIGYSGPSDSAWPGALDALCRVMPRGDPSGALRSSIRNSFGANVFARQLAQAA
jgi:hypothetical protein